MPLPDPKPRRTPVDRFRNILSAETEGEPAAKVRKPATVNLPKVAPAAPTLRPPAPLMPQRGDPKVSGSRLMQRFWTLSSIASLIMNVIVLAALIIWMRGRTGSDSAGPDSALLAGLYANLDLMDQAHITQTIPIRSSIPWSTSIPVQTTTNITLAHDVAIEGAHVKITTDSLNIDAPAIVTLPAGTSLDVALSFDLPVQTTLPVAFDVPVNIVVRDTDLHSALVGLKGTIKPMLCAASPNALSLTGEPVCR